MLICVEANGSQYFEEYYYGTILNTIFIQSAACFVALHVPVHQEFYQRVEIHVQRILEESMSMTELPLVYFPIVCFTIFVLTCGKYRTLLYAMPLLFSRQHTDEDVSAT